jgi:sugar lactone lactonase YvrE
VINTVGCGLDLTGDRTVTVTFTGPMTRIAGTGTFCSSPPNCNDNRPATSAQLNSPEGLAVDAAGNLYIADTSDQEIREVLTDGTITRIAGTGATCSVPGCGDGNAATSAQLYNPGGVAVDSRGNVYVADTFNQEIRRFSPGGAITTIAGSQGRFCDRPPNCGDGGPATAAQLDQPLGLAADGSGNVYVADAADNEIRKFAPGGTITTIAGTGGAGGFLRLCDDGAATAAQLDNPEGVAVDASGNVFIADTGHNEVCEVTAANMIRRIAGTGFQCQPARQCDHGSAAVDADLNQPEGVAVDSAGNVYVADTGDNEVRRISPDGTITTLASGLHHPFAVTVDSGGNVYIADTRDHEVLEAG